MPPGRVWPRFTRDPVTVVNLPYNAQNFLRSEFFRYLVAGFIAFFCDFSILIVGTEVLGLHYLVSNIGGYGTGLLVSYTLNTRWVFKHRRYGDQQAQEFVYFTTIALTALGISELVLWLATDLGNLHYTWSKIIATFFVFLFNFIMRKWLLFSPARQSKE